MQEISVNTYLYYIHGGFQEFIRNFFKCQHHLHFHSLLFSHFPPVFFVPMKIDFHIMRNVQYIFCIFHWTTINIDQKKNHYSHFHFNLRNELQFDLLPIEVYTLNCIFHRNFMRSVCNGHCRKKINLGLFFPKSQCRSIYCRYIKIKHQTQMQSRLWILWILWSRFKI